MIEKLIAYIQDKGFTVFVSEGVLLLRKYVRNEPCSIAWAIDLIELQYAHECVLFAEADTYMQAIDTAIAEREVLDGDRRSTRT